MHVRTLFREKNTVKYRETNVILKKKTKKREMKILSYRPVLVESVAVNADTVWSRVLSETSLV